MSEHSDTLATGYADVIVATILALEELSDIDPEELLEHAEGPAFSSLADEHELSDGALEELADLADGSYLEDHDGDVVGAWIDTALDVEIQGRRGLGQEEWIVTAVEVLVTAGGPDARVTSDGGESVLVSVQWGGPSVDRRVYAPTVAARIDDLGELY